MLVGALALVLVSNLSLASTFESPPRKAQAASQSDTRVIDFALRVVLQDWSNPASAIQGLSGKYQTNVVSETADRKRMRYVGTFPPTSYMRTMNVLALTGSNMLSATIHFDESHLVLACGKGEALMKPFEAAGFRKERVSSPANTHQLSWLEYTHEDDRAKRRVGFPLMNERGCIRSLSFSYHLKNGVVRLDPLEPK